MWMLKWDSKARVSHTQLNQGVPGARNSMHSHTHTHTLGGLPSTELPYY